MKKPASKPKVAEGKTGAVKKKAAPVAVKKKGKSVAKAAPKRVRVTAKPRAAAPKKKGEKGHNTVSRVDLFVAEYLIDMNGRQAAIRAGYSPQSARTQASDLLATPEAQAAIAKAMEERAERTGITQDKVLEHWWAVATADPRELTELHRTCCRFCWGFENHYQWTPNELRVAKADYVVAVADAIDERALNRIKAVDEVGGAGFDPRNEPNPACPECFGAGIEQVIAKDTRDLSPKAKLLYAGVKTTQHGLEVKTHSQGDALVNVAKHIGMLAQRLRVGATDDPADDEDAVGYVLIPAKKKRGDVEAD